MEKLKERGLTEKHYRKKNGLSKVEVKKRRHEIQV
jgi:hypothetical protein